MDWSIFWSAFGAIGTTIGSLITAIAIVIAVRQYKQPLNKHISIKFTTGFPVMVNRSLGDSLYCITVSNKGVRPIIITNIYLAIGDRKLIINDIEYSLLPRTTFPYTIEQEQAVEMRLPCNMVASEFISLVNNNKLSPYTKVKILVCDTSGGEHYYKTGFSTLQFAKYHD